MDKLHGKEAILSGINYEPHHFLGMHDFEEGWQARCFDHEDERAAESDIPEFFEAKFTEKPVSLDPIKTIEPKNNIRMQWDPNAFEPTISKEDLYLFNEGTHHRAYEKMGSRVLTINGVEGVAFTLWAPNAKRVSVVGDFNAWDGRCYPMRTLGNSGVWEVFIPGLKAGEKYKYELLDANGHLRLKSDPYALYFEGPPNNASIIASNVAYQWNDQSWMEQRAKTKIHNTPISIYEVHLDSWRRVVEDNNRPLNYRELATELGRYVKELGFTHIELLPVAEHPFLGSWGYQVTGFFAPTSRYGTPEDFKYFVDSLHQQGIGIIVDWVPGHFPRDEFSLACFDGTCLYEHADPRKGEHQDWGTLIFNYGRHEVRNFLMSSALSWFDRFHIDGVRVDAVASMLYLDYSRKEGEWVPNQYGGKENIEALEFLRNVNDCIHAYYPGAITIAEESTAFGRVSHSTKEDGLGFDFKWNMGWMHDVLNYFSKDPVCRKHHHNQLTFGMLYQYTENFVTVFSHDEVVHGKGSLISKMGSWYFDDKAQTLKALYGYMWGWPGKKTLFMGDEFGQVAEWNYGQSLDWHLLQYKQHAGIQRLIKDLNHAYRNYGFWAYNDVNPNGFSWIDPNDSDNSVVSFLRKGGHPQETLLVVSNFTPVCRQNYRIGVPYSGYWKEILNTNSSLYGGDNLGNEGGKSTDSTSVHSHSQSLNLCLPPLTTVYFCYQH